MLLSSSSLCHLLIVITAVVFLAAPSPPSYQCHHHRHHHHLFHLVLRLLLLPSSSSPMLSYASILDLHCIQITYAPSALDHGEPPTNLNHRSEPFKPPAFSTWQATEKDNSKQYRQLRRKHMPRNEIETFDIVEGKVPVNVIANKGRLKKKKDGPSQARKCDSFQFGTKILSHSPWSLFLLSPRKEPLNKMGRCHFTPNVLPCIPLDTSSTPSIHLSISIPSTSRSWLCG